MQSNDELIEEIRRLTAERDGLQSLYDDTQARLIALMKDAKVMESELTKARELIQRASNSDGISPNCPLGKDLAAYLTHQSAPAAKGLTEESRQEAIERHFGHFGDGE